MKKYLILGAFLFAFAGLSMADVERQKSKVRLPGMTESVTQGVYISSFTASSTSIDMPFISTQAAILYKVMVTSGGQGSPILDIYDTSVDTGSPGALRDLIATIDTTNERDYEFNVFFNSGIAIFNRGVIPANLTFIYRLKN